MPRPLLSTKMSRLRSPPGVSRLLGVCLLASIIISIYFGGWIALVNALIVMLTTALVVRDILGMPRAERRYRGLSENAGPGVNTSGPARVATSHSEEKPSAANGFATREHLLEEMTLELAGASRCPLLSVIRIAGYDRLAALDQDRAFAIRDELTSRMASAVGHRNVVARIDRHSFAVWFRDDDERAVERQLRGLLYVLEQEVVTPAGAIIPTIEVGSARASAEGRTAGQLLAHAIAALDENRGNGTAATSNSSLIDHEEARERLLIEQDLAQAIDRQQLRLVFQPLIDLGTSKLIGAEALLRWTHPTLGPISPARFIPIAEELGLIDRYGLWMLDSACRRVRYWHEQGLADFRVAVNLSARQLQDDMLAVKIERTLQRHRLSPRVLELELTETAAMADIERTSALFAKLRKLGVRIAIDDFKSGYSSLSYLKNLRFDKLKIDREFVTGIQDCGESRAICKALVELGRGLQLQVLAEGVETAEEIGILRGLGCSLFQGYYFSPPLEDDGLLEFSKSEYLASILTSPVHKHMHELERRLSA